MAPDFHNPRSLLIRSFAALHLLRLHHRHHRLLPWLASFKLLFFAFDLGPLASANSLPLFVAIAALPFKLKPAAGMEKKSKKLPLNLAAEIPISAALISLMFEYRDSMHPFVILIRYCCLVFLMIEILVELSRKAARLLLGLELESPSDEP